LAVTSEAAFYQTLEWQPQIFVQRFHPMTYPLIDDHLLWCFPLNSPSPLIDLGHSQAQNIF